MGSRTSALIGSAARLEQLIRNRGDYAHVHVQARAGHLVVKTEDEQGVQLAVARATPIGIGQYGLSFRNHAGKWEPLPVSGGMEQILEGMLDLLGTHLDRTNLQ